jgi:RNA polymerase sigma-32 factor
VRSKAKTALRPLVPSDPLQRYLAQIGQYDLLTPEQEHAFAVRYAQSKDPQAAYELTVRNLRLVVKIALEYRRAWSNILDLIQEGNIGLMTAIQHFDPYRQVRLSTYAAWWIRAYILKFIMSNWRLIKIGNTQAERKLFYNLKREQERLLAEGFSPGPKLLAERLKVSERDVREMSERMGSSEVSLDHPRGTSFSEKGDDLRPLGDLVSPSEEPLDEHFANREVRELVAKAAQEFRKGLKRREALLLEKRILADEPVTLRELGEQWNISRERVRQLEAKVLKKLQEYFREKYPDWKVNQ